MNSRKFHIAKNKEYWGFDKEEIDKDNFAAGLIIIKTIISDIDVILKDYRLAEDKIKELKEKRTIISNIYDKCNDLFSVKRVIKERDKLYNKPVLSDYEKNKLDILMNILSRVFITSHFEDTCVLLPQFELEENLKENFDWAQVKKIYETIYKDYQVCFELEDQIYQDIVIPIWKEYLTKYNPEYKQGEHFAYLFHSGGGFVVLPGMERFSLKDSPKDSKHKTDFISSSLITEREMETGNTNVGILIGIKDKTILTSFGSDCGTIESPKTSVTTIKFNEKMENAVCISSPKIAMPVSKLGTPINVERQAMEASISNTGEILNAGKWIHPIYTEVVVDKEDFTLEGILFKTTGCEINLKDFAVAKQMEMYYNKPLQIINQSICREKANLSPYTEEEKERFEKQLEFFSDQSNYTVFDQNPVLFKNLIKLYYQDVIEKSGFKGLAKMRSQIICLKIVEYLNSIIKEKKLKDDNVIRLDEIMNLNLRENDFPSVRYKPEIVWGETDIKPKEIHETVMDVPQNLETKVEEQLFSEVKIEKNMEER